MSDKLFTRRSTMSSWCWMLRRMILRNIEISAEIESDIIPMSKMMNFLYRRVMLDVFSFSYCFMSVRRSIMLFLYCVNSVCFSGCNVS